ncbi:MULTISPECIES: glycosyltransferase [Muribaculaceae]|jgi:glycosyltransferase involved in cell wall biosynthesis|uniref:glycosyltransferase n=1 Tax=Muribaculaceae TaxID=2005473 RepID=UPI00244DC4AD|nr:MULTISPECIES: glycosyltransferase [Muribaculaceae]
MSVKGRIVQINPVVRTNTSTGRIMQEIGSLAESNGWLNWCAYSKGRDGEREYVTETIAVGDRWSVAAHGVLTRLFDRHGLGSAGATRKFVKRLKEINPDIIHIHNIHGYFLNYPLLFEYLRESDVKVVWTVHDCWLYTGHCYYYSAAGCDKWQAGCGDCPQRGAFPRSLFVDRSRRNFSDKKSAFMSIPRDRMVIVPVSEWMREEMSKSFFRDSRFEVIHNGIDTSVFHPCEGLEMHRHLGVGADKKIILGLASIWSKEKGLDDFIKLSRLIGPDEVIVLVGVDDKTARQLPDSIRSIRRTENIEMLAQLYSEATAFVNPTWQDNYPTVNLEAISCGTPVVTYRTGGSIESVTDVTGRVVEQGDVAGLLAAVREIESLGADCFRHPCRDYALANFRKEDRYRDYLRLYENLLK